MRPSICHRWSLVFVALFVAPCLFAQDLDDISLIRRLGLEEKKASKKSGNPTDGTTDEATGKSRKWLAPNIGSAARLYQPENVPDFKEFEGLRRDIPLGPIGGVGRVYQDSPYLVISELQSETPGARGGLKVGDHVIGADGRLFELWDAKVGSGGKGAPEGLGRAIEKTESTSASYGTLRLRVIRGTKKLDVSLRLPALGALGKTWPYNCEKTDRFYKGICHYLAASQKGNGLWRTSYGHGSTYSTSAMAGLALLGSGEKKYEANVKQLADFFVANGLKNQGSNWSCFYTGVFLCEYFLATEDKRALQTIFAIADDLTKRMDPNTGRFGHGGLPVTYNGGGLNIVGTGVLWFWAMAEKCGWKIPSGVWEKAEKHVRNCTAGNGGVGYSFRSGDHQSHGRSGHMALAMYVRGLDPAYQKHLGGFMTRQLKSLRENHAFSAPGVMAGTCAMLACDPQAARPFFDYWDWYYTLARQPDFSAAYFGGKENNGGDTYLNPKPIMNACLGVILSATRKNLYIHGGFPRIEGVVYGQLSNRLRAIYRDLRDRKYRDASATLRELAANANAPVEVNAMLAYVDELAAQDFAEFMAARDTGDVLHAIKLRDAFVERFGNMTKHRTEVIEFARFERSPEGHRLALAGRKWAQTQQWIASARTPEAQSALLERFLEKYGDTYYGRVAREMATAR